MASGRMQRNGAGHEVLSDLASPKLVEKSDQFFASLELKYSTFVVWLRSQRSPLQFGASLPRLRLTTKMLACNASQ